MGKREGTLLGAVGGGLVGIWTAIKAVFRFGSVSVFGSASSAKKSAAVITGGLAALGSSIGIPGMVGGLVAFGGIVLVCVGVGALAGNLLSKKKK